MSGSKIENLKIYLALLCLLISIGLSSTESNSATRQLKIKSVIERLLGYLVKKSDQLNLDGLTGLRMVQAELEELKPADTEWIDKRLTQINFCLSKTSRVKQNNPQYFQDLGDLAGEKFWRPARRIKESTPLWLEVEELLLDKNNDVEVGGEYMTEDQSDHCIRQLIKQRCNISVTCYKLMSEDSQYGGYTRTHQLLYFIIMQQLNCLGENEDKALITANMRRLCAQIFIEASNQETNSEIHKDLFMEQIGLCGLAGYWREFSQPLWIDKILSWQKKSGCYGNSERLLNELEHIDPQYRFRRSTSGRSLSRVKREEIITDDGCLIHQSTVALLALTPNYRTAIENTQ